jgi:hypothetical protein
MTRAPLIAPSHWRRFHALAALVRSLGGTGPTVRQCAAVWGMTSVSQAHATLARLADLGLIRKLPARDRAIELCQTFTTAPGPTGQRLIPLWPEVQP